MTWHECILEWHGMTVTLLPIYTPIHYQIICPSVTDDSASVTQPIHKVLLLFHFSLIKTKELTQLLECMMYILYSCGHVCNSILLCDNKSAYCLPKNPISLLHPTKYVYGFRHVTFCIDLMLYNQSTQEISCGKICHNHCIMLEKKNSKG